VPELETLVTNIVDPVDPTVIADEANSNSTLINTGGETEFQFVQQLVQQAAPTACAAAAVYAAMYGAVPSSAELNILAAYFTPAQFAYAQQIGVADPALYCYQALGLGLALMSDTGSTSFAAEWGPANPSCPNTPDGNAAFVAQAYAAVFGHAGTQGSIDEFIAQVNFFVSLYTASPPVAGADADTICLLARGAVFGLMVGVAVENNIGPLADQVTNFLEDAGQGVARSARHSRCNRSTTRSRVRCP
jgi:hypothetical protein